MVYIIYAELSYQTDQTQLRLTKTPVYLGQTAATADPIYRPV